MSSANVDLVRSSFEAFGRGDFDTAFAAYDPAVEWHTADDEPDSQTYVGLAGVRRFAAGVAEPWTDRFGPGVSFGEFIDRGDWIVVPWSARVHGQGSGIEMEISETYAVLVEDGRIRRVEEYRTVEQALEAVEKRPRRGAGPSQREE